MSAILEVQGLSKRFGGVTAVDSVSFALSEGQVCGLIGPNGSGKSTTLHLLSGFLRQNGGTIRMLGRQVDRLSVHERVAMGVGRTFQAPAIFGELAVFDNVLAGCHSVTRDGRRLFDVIFRPGRSRRTDAALHERCWTALDRVGLADDAGRMAKTLSYGEQKLLDLARALVFQPKFLLLDEPAAGLGPELADRLAAIVQGLKGTGTTVLFAEHNMKIVMGICDRVIVLNFGKLIADGPPGSIHRNEEVVRAYLGGGYAA